MDLLPPWPPPIPEHSPGISGLLSHTESTALNSLLYWTKVLQNLWPFLLFSFPLSQNSPPFCWISPAFFFFFFVPSDPPICLRYAFVVRKQPGSRTKADRLDRYNGKQTQNLPCGAGHQLKKSILKCVVESRWGNGVVKARHTNESLLFPENDCSDEFPDIRFKERFILKWKYACFYIHSWNLCRIMDLSIPIKSTLCQSQFFSQMTTIGCTIST